MRGNAVDDSSGRTCVGVTISYAVGVTFHGLGSAKPQSGGAPPQVTDGSERFTPTVLHRLYGDAVVLWNAFSVRGSGGL